MRFSIYYLVLFLLWAAISCFVPGSIYWHDSSEFVLSGFFLDIAHPAGFPIFSQLSNLFALIPFGPIAWRVNAFCSIVGVLVILNSWLLCWEFLRKLTDLSRICVGVISIIPAAIFLSSGGFVRQLLTAEVYSLNALFVELTLLLFLKLIETYDIRFFYLSAALAGIALGNHVSFLFSIVPLAAMILLNSKKLKLSARSWGGGLVFFVATLLASYSFLPVRATASLSLNTGAPSTLLRVFNLISDKRDRELRIAPDISALADDKTGALDYKPKPLLNFLGGDFINLLRNDLNKLRRELGISILLAAGIGLVLGLYRYPIEASAIALAAAGNWLFFSGWDTDPWAPVLLCVGVFVAIFFSGIFLLPIVRRESGAQVFISVLISLGIAFGSLEPENLRLIREFTLPRDEIVDTFDRLDPGAIYLAESSWFFIKYLSDIEEYRRDIVPVYLPSIKFPYYFGATRVRGSAGVEFSSDSNSKESDDLERFVRFVAENGPLNLEPALSINSYLLAVMQLGEDGVIRIKKKENGGISAGFTKHWVDKVESFMQVSMAMPGTLRTDSLNYLEMKVLEVSDLVNSLGHSREVVELLKRICDSPINPHCSSVAINNLVVAALRSAQFETALYWGERYVETHAANRDTIEHNLMLVRKGIIEAPKPPKSF